MGGWLGSLSAPHTALMRAAQGSVAFLARAYAICMLVLALNYLFAQLLMEYAQTANEFKARETIKRANRIFVNVQENVPVHVALLTGAMFVTTGSGHESILGVCIIIYTMARTFWLICYAGALDPVTATPLLSLLISPPVAITGKWCYRVSDLVILILLEGCGWRPAVSDILWDASGR